MSSFAFWAVEVKPGESLSCEANKDFNIHISQATLGECEDESVNLFVATKTSGKVVIGTLLPNHHPIRYDLILEKEFELSHSSKTASVFVCGVKVRAPGPTDFSTDDEDKPVVKAPSVDDITDLADLSSSSADPEGGNMNLDDCASNISVSDEKANIATTYVHAGHENVAHVVTPHPAKLACETHGNIKPNAKPLKSNRKPKDGKKRVIDTALKTPTSEKNARIATASVQSTAKGAISMPGNSKQNAKTSKSYSCEFCGRTFVSDSRLQSHKKVKHT